MSLRGAISRLRSGTYTVTREAAATNDGHGRDIAGSTSTFSIVASIQPLDGQDLVDASEGKYGRDMVRGWTTTQLIPISDTVAGDVVAYAGKPYTVVNVKTWESFNAVHYIFDAARVGTPS